MNKEEIEVVKEALKRLNPDIDEIIYFGTDDFKECLKDVEKYEVDLLYIYNILQRTMDMKRDIVGGNDLYHEAFEDYENLRDGIELMQEGCSKIRYVLGRSNQYIVSTYLKKPSVKEVELEGHNPPENAELMMRLEEDAKTALRMITPDEEVELLKKVIEIEAAIKAYALRIVPKIGGPKHRPPNHYVSIAVVDLVNFLQQTFPPKKSAKVSMKACRYAAFFLYAAGFIDNNSETNLRKRYLEIVKRSNT